MGALPLALGFYKEYVLPVVHPAQVMNTPTGDDYPKISQKEEGTHFSTSARSFLSNNPGLPGFIPSVDNGTGDHLGFLTPPMGRDLVAEANTPCRRAKENSYRVMARPRHRNPYSFITRAVPSLRMTTIHPITPGKFPQEVEEGW